MATKIIANIDLAKIPEGAKKRFTHNDGFESIYANIDVTPLRDADEKGNTLSVSIYYNGERTYIGRGKKVEFGTGANNAPKQDAPKQTAPKVAPVKGGYQEEDGDLPF